MHIPQQFQNGGRGLHFLAARKQPRQKTPAGLGPTRGLGGPGGAGDVSVYAFKLAGLDS